MKLQFFSGYSIIIPSMKKVKHILATFLHSCIPQDISYPKLLHTHFRFSLKYYFVVMSFFALLFMGILFYRFSPLKMVSYKNSVINSLSAFPEDAVIMIRNGVLESNQNKPLFLWVYYDSQPVFVVMVYTKDMLTQSFTPLPLIFLGRDKAQISYRGTVTMHSYDPSWNMLITKERLQSLATHANSFFPSFIFFFYLFLIVLTPLIFIISSTVLILLSSALSYLLLCTFIPRLHFKKCIQAGMHGTHIPLFIALLLFSLFPAAQNIFVIAASLIFVFTLVSTFEMYSKEVTLHHSKDR